MQSSKLSPQSTSPTPLFQISTHDLPEYSQICEHVAQTELAEVVLVKDLQVFGPVLRAILILKGVAGAKHNLNVSNFESEVTELIIEQSGYVVSIDGIDTFKVILHQLY